MKSNFVVSSFLTVQHSMKIINLCQNIISTYKRIFAAVAINKFGRVIEINVQNNKGVTTIEDLTQKEQEILYMQYMLQRSMLGDFDNKFGASKYMLVEREKLLEFVFPFCKGIILVLCKVNINTRVLSGKLSRIINEFALESEAESLK